MRFRSRTRQPNLLFTVAEVDLREVKFGHHFYKRAYLFWINHEERLHLCFGQWNVTRPLPCISCQMAKPPHRLPGDVNHRSGE